MEAAAHTTESAVPMIHQRVMAAEVSALLCEHRALRIVDATIGAGGHAALLLEGAPSAACLLGLDRDPQALELAAAQLSRFSARLILRHADFADLDAEAANAGFNEIDALIADLGMSSFALDDPARGFSFLNDGPLDMRMNPQEPATAASLVRDLPETELARVIYEYGEEGASRRIARAIVEARRRAAIATTAELRALVERAIGGRRGRIHPATRTFQALRIAVNHELQSLERLLEKAPRLLAPGGRMAVIAYHSLEDRAVKWAFRELAKGGDFALLTAKALRPETLEVRRNPRSRSARLRCLERLG